MDADAREPGEWRLKDGRSWRIGGQTEVDWIARRTSIGLTIRSAIPAVFAAYATAVVPDVEDERDDHDQALIQLLRDETSDRPWWLGYLDTGTEDTIFPDVPMVTLYSGWRYVFVQAGPDQALTWRSDPRSLRGPIPDVIFPEDRAWLLSRLWDDDWRCLGGSALLVSRFVEEARLQVRQVDPDQNATPPGHGSR